MRTPNFDHSLYGLQTTLQISFPRCRRQGTLETCPITGRPVRVYPDWRRKVILCCVTGPLIVLSLVVVVLVTLGFVYMQEYQDAVYDHLETLSYVDFICLHAPKVSAGMVMHRSSAAIDCSRESFIHIHTHLYRVCMCVCACVECHFPPRLCIICHDVDIVGDPRCVHQSVKVILPLVIPLLSHTL